MKQRKQGQGPQFTRFMEPIIAVLKELGGAAAPGEVREKVIAVLGITEAELAVPNQNGQSRIVNQIYWAKFYLAKAGLIESSSQGLWTLTARATQTEWKQADMPGLFRSVQKQFPRRQHGGKGQGEATEGDAEVEPEELDHRAELLDLLQNKISAKGFERLCQRLLREFGFQHVEVTGRSADQGIDGIGVVEVNPFVSFRVLFQCKKYRETVGSGQIRDFRGAMAGRVDKGIVITTGTFSIEARKEASRDGVPPIELVDGEKLMELFEQKKLGLREKRVFEVDPLFFEEFQ